jgi:ubiquinone/menaquinone biosynthesis C-methylase UbiE
MTYSVFVLLWLVTFPIAWKTLFYLTGESLRVDKSPLSPRFISVFIFYRFIIAAPYIYLILAGQNTPGFIRSFAAGILLTGTVFSLLRFFGRDRFVSSLWWVYGYVYDGLRGFYPYQRLVGQVVDEVGRGSVLELGAGTGNVILELISRGITEGRIVATEPGSSMVKRLRNKVVYFQNSKDVEVVQSDAVSYLKTCTSSSFENIILCNVLYAVPDRHELWAELVRVLKPDGKVVVTNSDRSGSWPIIKEHLSRKSIWTLLSPKLLAVFVVDGMISSISKTGAFAFLSEEQIRTELHDYPVVMSSVIRTYGGQKDGVNILFNITKL